MDDLGAPFGFFLEKKEQANEVFKISDAKGPYRHLKREKRVWRSKADILFEIDEDELAIISCVLQKGALIVWNIIVTKPHSVLGYEEAQVAYLCVKRDGVWFYPLNAIINIVQQENDNIQVLKSWKEDRLRATKFIEHFVALPDETLSEAVFSGNMKTLTPITEEDT